MKVFEIPYIISLQEKFQHSKQCKMFGMPKRSCKALPSGISNPIHQNNKNKK